MNHDYRAAAFLEWLRNGGKDPTDQEIDGLVAQFRAVEKETLIAIRDLLCPFCAANVPPSSFGYHVRSWEASGDACRARPVVMRLFELDDEQRKREEQEAANA